MSNDDQDPNLARLTESEFARRYGGGRENQGQPTDALARVLAEIDECLRYEKTGTTVPVPVADLRVIRAALSGTTTEWGVLWSAATLPRPEWCVSREVAIHASERWEIPLVSREVTEWREVGP